MPSHQLYDVHVTHVVIYTCDAEHAHAYAHVQQQHPHVHFLRESAETSFAHHMHTCMTWPHTIPCYPTYTLFSCDDMFYSTGMRWDVTVDVVVAVDVDAVVAVS